MGITAENLSGLHSISREDQEAFAIESQARAAAARESGAFADEIVAIETTDGTVQEDGCIRPGTNTEALAKLRPAFDANGTVTAGTSSPLTDGGSAVILMNEEKMRAEGIEPMGYVRSWAWAALDPSGQLLQGPAYAVPLALDRAGLAMKDIGLMEMHEAFAAQVLSNLQALASKQFAEEELGRSVAVGHPDPDLINVMGGSLSIGHPFGATGGRLTITLLNEMARRDIEFGLITACAAGGMGFAMVVERR